MVSILTILSVTVLDTTNACTPNACTPADAQPPTSFMNIHVLSICVINGYECVVGIKPSGDAAYAIAVDGSTCKGTEIQILGLI